jgi:hypothetical protein
MTPKKMAIQKRAITYQAWVWRRKCFQSAGATTNKTDTAIKLPDKGRVKKVDHSPWLMVKAWRIDCSAMGARIRPTMRGAAGKSKRRIK